MTRTNRFYENTFNAQLGTLAKSASVRSQLSAVQAAFNLLQGEMDRLQSLGSITSLDGFPPTFTDNGLKDVRVNPGGTGLVFVTPGSLAGIKTVTDTAYELLLVDAGQLLLMENADPITVTVPAVADTAFVAGDVIMLNQYGAGQVTFEGAGGVTVLSSDDLLSTRGQYAEVALLCLGSDVWMLIGERNAATLNLASLVQPNTFTKAQTVTPVTLTDAATIATDAETSNTFVVTLGGNRTLGAPTNLRDGVVLNWIFVQDGTGSRTLAYNSIFKFPGGTDPTLSTAAGAIDMMSGVYIQSLNAIICVAQNGFA